MDMRKPIEILMIDDSPGDVRLAQEAFRESNIDSQISVARDGIEALAYLRKEGPYAEAVRPDLILLDLNMPRMNGHQVLAEIKADDNLKRIPVIVLTISKNELDILDAYDRHANCYITKPVDLHHFLDIVRSIEDFWLSVVQLPRR